MDELRPRQSMPYSDLLTILDPFDVASRAPARFKDPNLVADYFIVTSPFDPKTFFNVQFDDQTETCQPIENNAKQNAWNNKPKYVQNTDDEEDNSLDTVIPSDTATTEQEEHS